MKSKRYYNYLGRDKKSYYNEGKSGTSYLLIIEPLTQLGYSLKEYFIDKHYEKPGLVEDIIGYSILLTILIGAGVWVISILLDEEIWKTDETTPEIIANRTKKRGLIASVFTSLIMGLVNGLMCGRGKSDGPTYQVFISMVVGGIIGFVMDNAIATEQGANILNGGGKEPEASNFSQSLKYGFGNIWNPTMPRYIITVLLDIFISIIFTDLLIKYSSNMYFFRRHKVIRDTILVALVAFVTFLAYANATRLEWAYPPTDSVYSTSSFIPTSTILLASVISAMVFLVWKPVSQEEKGISRPGIKLSLVVILFALIVFLYQMDWLNPVPSKEIVVGLKNPINNDENFKQCFEHSCNETSDELDISIRGHNLPSVQDLIDSHKVGIGIYITIFALLVFFTMNTSYIKYTKGWWVILIIVMGILLVPAILGFF